MKKIAYLTALLGSIFVGGCSGEEAPMKTDPATVMNPSGNEANLPPEAQGLGAKYKAAGEAGSRNMDEMSRQMNAARAKAEGK